MIRPITKHTVPRQVAEMLIEYINANSLKEGDRLPSLAQLAKLFQVGTPAIREGLKYLQGLGVVRVQHGRGIFVENFSLDLFFGRPPIPDIYHPTPAEIEDLMHVRRIVEMETTRLAVYRATDADLDVLEEKLALMRNSFDDHDEFITHDMGFHETVAKASKNVVFPRILSSVRDLCMAQQKAVVALVDAKSRALEFHSEVLAGIRERDERRAVDAMRDHLDDILNRIMRSLPKD